MRASFENRINKKSIQTAFFVQLNSLLLLLFSIQFLSFLSIDAPNLLVLFYDLWNEKRIDLNWEQRPSGSLNILMKFDMISVYENFLELRNVISRWMQDIKVSKFEVFVIFNFQQNVNTFDSHLGLKLLIVWRLIWRAIANNKQVKQLFNNNE